MSHSLALNDFLNNNNNTTRASHEHDDARMSVIDFIFYVFFSLSIYIFLTDVKLAFDYNRDVIFKIEIFKGLVTFHDDVGNN